MKKIGLYGGTFSPPHLGHLHAVQAFAEGLKLDEIIVMPTNIPPHKAADPAVDPALRYAMTCAAFSDFSSVRVSDWEISAGSVSYTADTLIHLDGQGQLFFLCGTDMFLSMESWSRPAEIFSRATIAVARRDAYHDIELTNAKQRYEKKYQARILILTMDPFPISSSEIREAVKNNQAVDQWLPPAVSAYIKACGLYLPPSPPPLTESLIACVRTRESPSRFFHTMGVIRECLMMARLFDMQDSDRTTLATAALLHDITKNVLPQDQPCLAKQLGISLSNDDLAAPPVLHALTGAALAARDFAEVISPDGIAAIACHTTGRPNMTLMEKLLFLADYIEPGRTYESCRRMRRLFYTSVPLANDRTRMLNQVILAVLDETIEHLEQCGQTCHPATKAAAAFLHQRLN